MITRLPKENYSKVLDDVKGLIALIDSHTFSEAKKLMKLKGYEVNNAMGKNSLTNDYKLAILKKLRLGILALWKI